MNKATTPVVIGFLLLILSVLLLFRKDGFTSPGTMVQLATSHVPTAEDYYYYKNIYPKVVRHDITDMTGSDPGPIGAPSFLTYP
jgi:hypothetical protein